MSRKPNPTDHPFAARRNLSLLTTPPLEKLLSEFIACESAKSLAPTSRAEAARRLIVLGMDAWRHSRTPV